MASAFDDLRERFLRKFTRRKHFPDGGPISEKLGSREFAFQILVGVILIVFGLMLATNRHSSNETQHSTDVSNIASPILHHLGTAILTAGVLMVTVEAYAKWREAKNHRKIVANQDRYVSQIREAQTESLLKTLMPDPEIFNQVKSQIIQQPFIRRNMHAVIHLKWYDADRASIEKVLDFNYEICNTSSNVEESEVRMMLQSEVPGQNPGSFERLTISSLRSLKLALAQGGAKVECQAGKGVSYDKDQLLNDSIVTSDGDALNMHIYMTLESKQEARVSFRVKSIENLDDKEVIMCLLPTVNMQVDVHPDKGIDISHSFLHPSGDVLQDDPEIKSWRIESGILPYQGIEIFWRGSSKEAMENGVAERECIAHSFIADIDSMPADHVDSAPERINSKKSAKRN